MRLAFRYLNTKSINNIIARFRTDLPVVVSPHREIFYKKVSDLNNWYTRIIGLDEVKLYQDRVVHLQERLLTIQEKRREISRHLAEIRQKSTQLQDEINKVKRDEDLERFLHLMKEETEVLRLEKEVARKFQEYDQEERELFTAFSNAIRDSHEKQRAQLEYTKYFGIVLSIVGSFLAFCYSTLRKNDLKHYIMENLEKNGPISSLDNEKVIDVIRDETQKVNQAWERKLDEVKFRFSLLEEQEKMRRRDVLVAVGGSVLAALVILKMFPS